MSDEQFLKRIASLKRLAWLALVGGLIVKGTGRHERKRRGRAA